MEICSQLITNKFEINFVNSGINEVLDEVSQEYDEVKNKKISYIESFKSLIGSKLKGAKEPIKTHFTDKSGMYFYATC